MSKKRHVIFYPAVTLLLGIAMRFICYFQEFSYRMRTDDFGTLIVPAYLAGYDWRSYASASPHYYGFGYYWIMAPLFKMIDSPHTLLLAISVVNSLMVALTGVLIYYLLTHYLKMDHGITAVFLALIPQLFISTVRYDGPYWLRSDNELPLFLGCWLCVWALLAAERAMNAGFWRRCLHAFLVSLALFLAFTVHERVIALAIAVAAVELFLYLTKRKWLLQPAAFFGSLGAAYVLQRFLRRAYIHFIWSGGQPAKNTNAFKNVSVWFLESRGTIKALLTVLIGNLHSLFVKGFGIPAIAMILVIVWCIRACVKNRETKGEWISGSMLIMLTFGAAAMVTIAGLCVQRGAKLYQSFLGDTSLKGHKGICYGRYYMPYIGPIALGALLYLYQQASKVKRGWAEASWAIFGTVEVFFFAFVYQVLLQAPEYVSMAYGLYLKRSGDTTRLAFTILIPAVVLVLLTFACTKYRKLSVAAAMIFILLYVGLTRVQQIDSKAPSIRFQSGERITRALTALEEQDLLPENLYLPYTNWAFPIQFSKKELSFIRNAPAKEQLSDNNLVICSEKQESPYLDAGYEGFRIGKRYIYTNDPQTAQALADLTKKKKP